MFRKKLLPIYTVSSLFVVVSCGDTSSHGDESMRGQAFQVTESDEFALEGAENGAQHLDPQLAEFSRVNDSEATELEGEIAEAISADSPMSKLLQQGTYLVSLQPLKGDPQAQLITHLYCAEKSKHFSQCVVFDGNNEQANLIGVKYVISKEAFELLPTEERSHWHPQNYSILSGQLMAPGRSAEDEKDLLSRFMNSYAKLWLTWKGIQHERDADPIPLGEAQLGWSFTADAQLSEGLIEHRDEQLNVNTEERRQQRQDLADMAEAQCGIDMLAQDFGVEMEYIPGVQSRAIEECYGEDFARPEHENDQQPAAPEKLGVPEAEEPAEQPIEQPVEEPAEQPIEEPVEEPAEQPIQEPAEPVTEEPAEQPTEEPATEVPVNELPEQQVDQEQAEEPAEEPVDEEPVEEPIEEEPAEEKA